MNKMFSSTHTTMKQDEDIWANHFNYLKLFEVVHTGFLPHEDNKIVGMFQIEW